MGDALSNLAFAAICLLALGIFLMSLAEAALLGANRQLIRRRAQAGDSRAQALEALLSQGDYITALIAGINAAVLGISTLATLLVWHRVGLGAPWLTEVVHLATIAALVALAELAPKTYGAVYADEIALAAVPAVSWLTRFLGRPVATLTRFGDAVLSLGRMPPLHRRHFVTEEDIQAVADLGEEEGLVEPEEGRMLDQVIEMGELTARDTMVPRIDVVGIREDASLDEALDIVAQSGYSRLPVYRGSLDDVVGVVHANDLLRCLLDGGRWQDAIRPPLVVAETTPLHDVFSQMREARVHIAIVADEFGGTAGIATTEDILEELVGEIVDEHDTGEQDVVTLADGEWLVAGRLRLAELYRLVGQEDEEPETGPETVAGLLAELTGRIPASGERIEHRGIVFTVEDSDGQHVEKVRVKMRGAS
ncbi:MAG: hemolysin family protein [Armatimonadetes bacterium]|nr:hemolysin family protein [Armatimonadota bacterium]